MILQSVMLCCPTNANNFHLQPLQRAHPKGQAYFHSGALVLISIVVFQGFATLERSSPKLQIVGHFF